ncbi:MAG: glucose-6-phosphate dehydrogenase [Patescibacteria group bacterium]
MSDKFNIPTVIVVFGATGDLARKKIFPALYNLYKYNQLPEKFSIIGSSRSARSDDEFRSYLTKIITEFEGTTPESDSFDQFLSLCTYHQAEFSHIEDYKQIAQALGRNDEYWSICSNKLYYLAVPPKMYKGMLHNLADSGLTEPCSPEEGWTRVLIEKPLGYDEKTAEEIDDLLGKLFKEEQVYRIDHYLAKEMVQNILTFRFANNLLEESWNSKSIEKIEIRMLENFGVDNRGDFYDALGALRDVGQNHILQMLALTLMDCPGSLTEEKIREKRTELLQHLMPYSREQIKTNTFRAQYEGYRKTEGVDHNSNRETYFRLKTFVDHPRWQGMPIYLESGKQVGELRNEVVVTFKENVPRPPSLSKKDFRNKVTFGIEPKEEIAISFIAKKPGLQFDVQENIFTFSLRDTRHKNQKAEEYERVLLDCIRGDQMLFVSTEEVQAMWRFIDPIVCAWEDKVTELHTYNPGSRQIREQACSVIEERNPHNSLRKQIGMIGLGKMGGNAALQLIDKDWEVYGYNRTDSVTQQFAEQGLRPTFSLEELVSQLERPRVLWIMVPAGGPVDEMIFGGDGTKGLVDLLESGDIIIDAGNSNYKQTQERAQRIQETGIKYVDCGTSGGPGGARYGACLMVGGKRETFEYLIPLFKDLSVPNGFAFFPGDGAGHFVKMVHNGIEYGMMQAIAEGYEVMKESPYKLDLEKITSVYNHGSVIESRLIGWLHNGFRSFGADLDQLSTTVHHSGEGQWTIEAAKELGVQVPIIEGSLQYRIDSEKRPSFAGKVLNTLRKMFGGHENT